MKTMAGKCLYEGDMMGVMKMERIKKEKERVMGMANVMKQKRMQKESV
jgi:hypothetical protein